MTADVLTVTRMGVRFKGRRFPCAIGKGGTVSGKVEGDGATPRASMTIVGGLYRPDRMKKPSGWFEPILPRDLWSDDPLDPQYNHLVSHPHPYRHEVLRRPDPLYDLILLTDWNWPNSVAGKGSAIFMHRWRRPRHPTQGCVAMDARHLLWIAKAVSPGTIIMVH